MKTTIPMQRVGETDGAIVRRPRRGVLRWALAGFGLGVVAATAYLLLGGDYFLNVPRWADILFYPGFRAGFQVYQWGLRVAASELVGVLAVGLAYAALAVMARALVARARTRHKSAALRQNSE
jgi:hypothetical protein